MITLGIISGSGWNGLTVARKVEKEPPESDVAEGGFGWGDGGHPSSPPMLLFSPLPSPHYQPEKPAHRLSLIGQLTFLGVVEYVNHYCRPEMNLVNRLFC